jgi:serine protease inhibitor
MIQLLFLEKGSQKNFVWSPFSAHSAFSQVLLGSSDSTRTQLENALGILIDWTRVRRKRRNK